MRPRCRVCANPRARSPPFRKGDPGTRPCPAIAPRPGQICRAATAKLEHHAVLAGLQFGQQIFRRSKRQRFGSVNTLISISSWFSSPGAPAGNGIFQRSARALSWMADRATLVEKCGRCIRAAPRPRESDETAARLAKFCRPVVRVRQRGTVGCDTFLQRPPRQIEELCSLRRVEFPCAGAKKAMAL